MTEPAPRTLALACLAFQDVDPAAHLAAAARAGFGHVTLRVTGSTEPGPGEVGLDPRRLARLRRALDATGLGVLDVEVLRMDARLTTSDVQRTVEAAAVLGARHLLIVNSTLDPSEATERLGEIVELSSDTGVRPCLEFMRFTRCRNLADAIAVAAPAGGGVLVDALHLFRSGDGPGAVADAVREYGVDLFPYVQLCDAPAHDPSENPPDDKALRCEAVTDRLLPGDGKLPLRALLNELRSDLPLAVEAPTQGLRRAEPDVRATEAMRALQALLSS